MRRILNPVTITTPSDLTGQIPGTTINIALPADLGTVAYVKIANESPCAVSVSGLVSGNDWLDPYVVDIFPLPDGLTTSIGLTPYNVLGVSSTPAPAAFALVTWYTAGEQPGGSYPVSLQRLTNIGNTVLAVGTDSVTNTGNPAGTVFVSGTAAVGAPPGSNVTLTNDGDLKIGVGGAAETEINRTGLLELSGQTTAAGTLGAPVIVAKGEGVAVTVTTQQTITTFTTGGTAGIYVAYLFFDYANGSPTTITSGVHFTDANGLGSHGINFNTLSGNLNALAFAASAGGVNAAFPLCIRAAASSTVSVTFQDSAGTPNDLVSAFIVRIS